MPEDVLLNVKDIDVFYGTLQILWNVSLEVLTGELVAIAGANGAGKSTLLKTIAGMMHPTTGNIEFLGEDISRKNAYNIVTMGISLVPEGRGLFPEMTVSENLMIGSYNRNARALSKEQLCRVYDLFPILKERKNQMAKTLSGGEQQMLVIGRGLMSNPKLLIIDEMSLGLSPLIVNNLFQVLHEIKEAGVTLLLVEQNVWKTLHEADRAYVIETGRIVMSGDALKLCEEVEIRNAYFGV
ncbi:MAG: ABC transporter ATP-binding protein [Chloroflexi bacterium RBG_16_48_8]|nr:MAG: ABC transporter ATP-binding protein [Chloroflexi bacterium RBG_16_48_8]